MKVLWILAAFALVVAGTPAQKLDVDILKGNHDNQISEGQRSVLINILIRQLFELIRRIINGGSNIFGIPPLDPLVIEHLKINIPAGLINLEMEIIKGMATGVGDFVVHRSHLDLRELSFDIDISVPTLHIKAEQYKLNGNFYTAIPFFGEGEADLLVDNFRFNAKLFLKQSEDGESILIDRIESPGFVVNNLKSAFTGIIGGGDIDVVANAIIEEVVLSYINRLNRAIALVAGEALTLILNPILDQLDSWRYIDMLL
nr:silk gland uncharacterized 4 [Tineola bisselliella]